MTSQGLFDSISAALAGAGVVKGTMFGVQALKSNRRAIACLHGEDMAFRLGRDSRAHGHAMALDGARLFDPSGAGRPFRDWVLVPPSACVHWQELAEAALDHAQGLDAAALPDSLE